MFVPSNPNTALQPFRGLDRSKIPATPDCLIKEGPGLEIFLRTGSMPTKALGGEDGPAMMSYGRALTEIPDRPQKDSKEEMQFTSQADNALTDAAAKKRAIEATLEIEPRTEKELRALSNRTGPPSTAQLSHEQQWVLFGKTKMLPDIVLSSREYLRLQARRAREEIERPAKRVRTECKGEPPSDPVTSEASMVTTQRVQSHGWPVPGIEGPDFAGYTNWLHDCKKVDRTVTASSLRPWKRQWVDRVNKVTEEIKESNPQNAPGYHDKFDHPDPRTFLKGSILLGHRDLNRLGYKSVVQKE